MNQPTPQPRTGAPPSRDIVIGATVYGHDNARFGSVAGSYRNYLIVERGFFMPVDYYVPMAAIERTDRDLVVLAVTRDAALTQGWERPPFTSETGQRGLRQPAVGRPAATPAAPGSSAAARTRQPGTPTGTNPTGTNTRGANPTGTNPTDWPAPAGAAAAATTEGNATPTPSATSDAASAGTVPRQPVREESVAPKETTAISPAAAFADTYAVGTNTDSYQAMTDFAPSGEATAGTVPSTPSSPEPGVATPGQDDRDRAAAAPSTDESGATDSPTTAPTDRTTA